ncbi:C2H2-type zinc finger protein [Sporobolomyces koalae]|uniref:C2H2-type zinc finger protein n=1 Tax=Sporobolomyces koalae TaxID=500713 RepID=UPI0031722DFB
MAPMSSTADAGKKKASKERLSTCSYCPMTFKKLEHAQRHERTHTLDRPYSCDACGKTFARQDTLHRHARLHSRTTEEGPAGKGPKKRRASTSSATPAKAAVPKSPKLSSSSASSTASSSSTAAGQGKSSSKVPPKASPSPAVPEFSSSSSAFGLSMSLPLHPPSFPAYSEPEHLFASTSCANADFPALGHANSIDPAVLPLHRGVGHASTGYGPTRSQPARRATHSGTQNGGPAITLEMNRPRALTLAGLPESFGCFSLINSPASSTASLSPAAGEDIESESEDNDDDDYRDSGMEDEGATKNEKMDPDWTIDSPSYPPAPESHYPSPAFSNYSPSALHTDSLTDLQAILDNDPIPSNAFSKTHQRKTSSQSAHEMPQLATGTEPDFDFEAFAASIEGGGSVPLDLSASDSYVDESIDAQKIGAGLFERYPTPPTDPITNMALPPTSETNDFDWLNQFTASAEAQQQAREDAAATAAMFSRGFGLDPTQCSVPASTSALGLSLGLPTPPLTAMAMHAHVAGVSNATANVSSSPHISFPVSSANTFSNLHATYASKYPTFSLPSVTIVPSPAQSAPSSHPSISMPSNPGTTTANSPSLHDLLAAAWERRQRQPTVPANVASSSAPVLTASTDLASAAKRTPAFYIPSALHSSANQIGTATTVDAHAGIVNGSGPLSLPIPTWASVPGQ